MGVNALFTAVLWQRVWANILAADRVPLPVASIANRAGRRSVLF